MIMNKNWIIYILLVGILYSCQEDEDILEPSYADVDRVASQVDLTNATVKDIYENFNVGVLYEYDDTLDFAYTAEDADVSALWGSVEIPEIKTLYQDSLGNMSPDTVAYYEEYVNAAIAFVDTAIFQRFDPSSTVITKFPKKVLIAESIYAESKTYLTPLTESESRSSRNHYGALSMVYNRHSFVIAFNPDEVERDLDAYILDDFYVFFNRVMEMNDLFSMIPESFSEGKDAYYGQEMDSLYRADMGIDAETTVYSVDRDWVYSKGFIDAIYFYYTPYGLGTVYDYSSGSRVTIKKGFKPSYDFVADMETDVRSYISEMLHRNATEIAAFPANIRENMRTLYNLFTSWGVDFASLNPDLEVLNSEE